MGVIQTIGLNHRIHDFMERKSVEYQDIDLEGTFLEHPHDRDGRDWNASQDFSMPDL